MFLKEKQTVSGRFPLFHVGKRTGIRKINMNKQRLLTKRSFRNTQRRIQRLMKIPYGTCKRVVWSLPKPKPYNCDK